MGKVSKLMRQVEMRRVASLTGYKRNARTHCGSIVQAREGIPIGSGMDLGPLPGCAQAGSKGGIVPWKSKQPCTHSGCGNLTDSGRCKEHRQEAAQAYERRRSDDETRRFYNSRSWRRASKLHLVDEPLCRLCGAIAVMTDHILPIKNGGERWDEKNWQSLCASCHSRKSAEEGSRFGRRLT